MTEKMTEQSFLEKAKRFFTPLRNNKRITFYFLFYFCIELTFGVVFVFFVKDITESFELQNTDKFVYLLKFYAGVIMFLFIVLFLCHKFWTYSYNRFRKTIESDYLPQYSLFDTNYYEKVGTGKSIAIISKGIKLWSGLLDSLLIQILRLMFSVTLTFYLLAQINIGLSLFFIVLLFLGNVIGVFLNSKVIHHRKKRIELDNRWSRRMVKIIMAKMQILQSGRILGELEHLHELHEGQIFYNKKMSFYLVPFFALGFTIVGILLFGVFLYFGKLYFNGEISLGLIAGITGAILMMQNVFVETLDFLKNFTKEFSEVQVFWDFFDNAPQIKGYEEGSTFEYKKGSIQLKDVSYSYDSIKSVFKNFSLKIPGNQITALVGPSGGGKSTLVKLIAGYIRQDSGDILVDKQSLTETSLKSYYADVGYLTQEPSVFDGTVRENLMYGVSSGEDQEKNFSKHLKKIIKLAHCEFIYELPDGLDTEIGERGIKLSGGQKQRLAIAKIFLKDPKIIILDEPTSALDSLSEKKITEAMHNLFKNRTVLVIAHRLQTVKHADDIIVIENGKVIERGTHKELLKNKGFYKQMLDLQSGF